jgi:phenylacetic acid degradation operon negative regulatory protein
MLHFLIVANNGRIRRDPVQPPSTPLLDPLSPRSIVLSLLLGSHPPTMAVGRILQFTSLFDLADGAVRTALSRMVAGGDLVNDDGTYRLAGRLVERQAQQDIGRLAAPDDWDGTWWTVAVVSDRRTMTERRSFRAAASGARLGELRPEVWLRPANIDLTADLTGALVTRGPIVVGDERDIVAQLWDLDAIEARAGSHDRALAAASIRLHDADDRALAEVFVTLAAAQQFLRVEPQLPGELVASTAGVDLRARYADVVDTFQRRLSQFFTAQRGARLSTDER